jgi:hypothetical protein
LSDIFEFPELEENNSHIVANHVGPNPGNQRYVDDLDFDQVVKLMDVSGLLKN